MRNKKGMGTTKDIWNAALISLILGVVFLAVFGLLYMKGWADAARGVGEDEKCSKAVDIAARTGMGKDLKECKAIPITIKDSKNKDAAREQLAQTMKRCWDKFGANKQPPLDPFVNKYEFCAVCSINTFEGFSEDIDGFALYLAEHNPSGDDRTYYEYFNGAPATDDIIKYYREDKTKISTKVRYATVLYATKETNWEGILKGLGIGGGIGAGVATTGVIAVLSLVPGINVITWTTLIVVGGAAAIGAGTGGIMAAGQLGGYAPMVLLVPYDYSRLSVKCIDLGVEPFEGYFS
ncbi:MAG: hypothetical protein Q7J54_01500 [Candidatus Woesearchaeota archaeon]|nr:hypothetical protein [Candidatus Woesearchaeota archaeon]